MTMNTDLSNATVLLSAAVVMALYLTACLWAMLHAKDLLDHRLLSGISFVLACACMVGAGVVGLGWSRWPALLAPCVAFVVAALLAMDLGTIGRRTEDGSELVTRRVRLSGWFCALVFLGMGVWAFMARNRAWEDSLAHVLVVAAGGIAALTWLMHVVWRVADVGGSVHADGDALWAQRLQNQEVVADARLASLKDATARSHRLQREFLATMSHELRTPLSCIVGLARLWEQDVQIPDDARKDMGTVERMAVQLLRMVDDGLAFVQNDGRQSRPVAERVRMRHLVRDLHAMGKWLAVQQKNEFLLLRVRRIPSSLVFDERRTRQILINLLSNAARYCEGGTVSLGVDFREVSGRCFLNWVVRDTGRGMDTAEQQRFFEPFTKSRDSQGLGLGLTLVRRMVQELGGQIDLQSTQGVGTAFAVLIPVARSEADHQESRLSPESGPGREDLPSVPMDLLPSKDYADLDFASLRRLIRHGQISEIGEWLAVCESLALSDPARLLIAQLRRAHARVDLELMQTIIDQVDTPLSFI